MRKPVGFATLVLAAGDNKALIESYGDQIFPGIAHERVLAMTSQLLGMSIAAAAGGDDKDQAVAGWVAQQATIYNVLEHHEVEAMIKEARECTSTQTCAQIREKFAALNNANAT